MTEQVPEGNQPEGDQSQGHPAWQSILDVLNDVPDDLRPVLEPKLVEQLKAWDQGVEGKLQEARSQYDPYKPLLENNIPMDRVQQALWLAHELESNPQGVVDQAIKAFDLGYVPASQQSSNNPSDDEDEEYGDLDLEGLENHPAFKALKEQAEQIKAYQESQKQTEEQQTASQQLEAYLADLHTEHGEFNDLYVTALMAQGADPKEAIVEYQAEVRKAAEAMVTQTNQNNENPPPIVMGEEGTSGSGLPESPTDMGALSNNEVADLVAQMIKSGQAQSTG